MRPAEFFKQLEGKGADKEQLAGCVARQPRLLPHVFLGLTSRTARVRFGCAGVLVALSEQAPGLLYPHLDRLMELTESQNSILQWTGFRAVANLAEVDEEGGIEGLLDRYLAPVRGPAMITAATVMAGGARIARAKPHLADAVAEKILEVRRARYKTAECRNVAIGHAIEALGSFYGLLKKPQPVIEFVRRQLRNTRMAVRKKAVRFLKSAEER